jgi:hypothetical protein
VHDVRHAFLHKSGLEKLMKQPSAWVIFALVMAGGVFSGSDARAADPIAPTSRLVSLSTAPVPRELSFSVATAQDLIVTLTDLQYPAAMSKATVVVTQGDAIAGSASYSAPATSANVEILGAAGDFTMRVFGTPDANFSVGTFAACVAPKADPANCIQTASFSDNISVSGTANDPTLSTLSVPLTVTTGGGYTFNFTDLAFPLSLSSPPNLGLFQGATPVPGGQGFASGTTLSLNAGTYRLLVIAKADATAKSGLYGLTISGPPGVAALFDEVVPVGAVQPSAFITNPSAQQLTLKVSDYGFPSPLASASVLLTSGGSALGTANAAAGAVQIAAPASGLKLWSYAAPGAGSGTYNVDLSAGSDALYSDARAVNTDGASGYAFAFTTPAVAAGTLQASAVDLQFPSSLSGLAFAVAQNGVVISQSPDAGALTFTASAAPVAILVNAQTPASSSATGNGLFDVNLQSGGASPSLLFDRTQAVGSTPALFDSQSLTLGTNGSFDATLTDLEFPARFDNLALVVSRGSEVLGKIFGGGTFTFAGSPGVYQVTFIATPAATEQYGLYALKTVVSPPLVSLSSSVATVVAGESVKLSWSAAGADTCTASGGNWTGTKAVAATDEVVKVDETTTFTLACTGPGGTTSKSVSVTATPKPAAESGGGGAIDRSLLSFLVLLAGLRIFGRRAVFSPA